MSRVAPIVAMRAELERFIAELSDAERLVLPYMYDLWLRPEQRPPAHDWRFCGLISGRGWGKTMAIAIEINRRVEYGEARHVALMAPTERRAVEVQIKALIDCAPPWFRPVRHNGGLLWPNGVRAVVFTPEAPDRPRSENIELAWCCELVDWQHNTRREAWDNIATATRIGSAQIFWDTTSKGKNDLILAREAEHASDPNTYPILRGTTFDNPMLPRKYLASVCAQYAVGSRRYNEEILGRVYAESQGALWQQAWLDDRRVATPPSDPELRLVGLDPAMSDRPDADETGIVVASRARGHVYVEADLTGRYKPEVWGDIAVQQCADRGASGVVLEVNHGGDPLVSNIRARAKTRGLEVRMLGQDANVTFPRRHPQRIYVRPVVARSHKIVRAVGPATETEAGRVHIVGTLPELETEFTTFEAGTAKSPNRYDAAVYVITELAELMRDRPRGQASENVISAVAAANDLRDRLRSMGRGRRIGL